MHSAEARARRIAERQAGTITRRQALATGMTDRIIQRRVLDGVWTRLDPGTFLIFGEPSPQTRLAAAVVALPAVVSHEWAAGMHGMDIDAPVLPTVSIQHRFSNRFAGVTVHESTDLAPGHVEERDGLPVTNPPRTIFDCAHGLGERGTRKLIEHSVLQRLTNLDELAEILRGIGRRGRPGTATMRSVMKALTGSPILDSELEQRFTELLLRAGFPPPATQFRAPWLSAISGRVDFAFPDQRVILECDGRRWHSTSEAFQRDRHRDNLAQLNGWTVLRFTWEDVTQREAWVLDAVRRALRGGSA